MTPDAALSREFVDKAREAADRLIAGAHAMTAGIYAGRGEARAGDCPFEDGWLAEKWNYGRTVALRAAEDRRKRSLLAAGRAETRARGRWDLGERA